jgi:hypothetical protein
MANFIDRLSEEVENKRAKLRETLNEKPRSGEEKLRDLVQEHWYELPINLKANTPRAAFAVDGSRAVRHLANSAYLFVAQGLMIGEIKGQRVEESAVDIEILEGATPTPFVNEAAGLMMIRLEASLARRSAELMPSNSVLFIDGALYGIIPNLYPFREYPQYDEPSFFSQYRQDALGSFLKLFETCNTKQMTLVSIAKTSTESTHTRAWWRKKHGSEPPKISDSEALYRWTSRAGKNGEVIKRASGYSRPVLLGKHAFAEGRQKEELLGREDVVNASAIVSFFVRLDDFDDALRIDVPAICIGRDDTIGTVEEELLIDPAEVIPILQILAADYGGLEVYNALLYSVDREVRLRQEMMDEVYIPLIESELRESDSNIELRLDRSERRFHST